MASFCFSSFFLPFRVFSDYIFSADDGLRHRGTVDKAEESSAEEMGSGDNKFTWQVSFGFSVSMEYFKWRTLMLILHKPRAKH